MRTFHLDKSDTSDQGFSLLEMLVVLAIVGVVLSVVGVRLGASVDSAKFVNTAENAVSEIKNLRLEALLNVQDIQISGNPTNSAGVNFHRLNLPEGWSVSGEPIFISKTGICSGGNIILTNESGRSIEYELSTPKCDPIRIF